MIKRTNQTPVAPNGAKSTGCAPPAATDLSAVPAPSSLMGAAASLAVALARFAASGFKTVDEALHELRMGQCGPCKYRRDTQCALCRCFIAKKAWLPHEDCPIGRWPS